MQVESGSIALRSIFDLKVTGIHLTDIIIKVWIINGQYVIDVIIVDMI